jgi:hypothetical protein
MRNIADIPSIPDPQQRLDEITVDCYGPEEALAAFEVYLSEALAIPFAATWRDPDEPGHAAAVTVLGVAMVDDRRGILLKVRQRNGSERRVLAEQLWANDPASASATVLNDYRDWIDTGGPGYDDDWH